MSCATSIYFQWWHHELAWCLEVKVCPETLGIDLIYKFLLQESICRCLDGECLAVFRCLGKSCMTIQNYWLNLVLVCFILVLHHMYTYIFVIFQASSNIVCLSQRHNWSTKALTFWDWDRTFNMQLNALIRYYQGRLKLLLLYVKRLLEYI